MKYRTAIVGNVSNRWTAKGQQREMEALSAAINAASNGERLHSLQPVWVFNMMGNASGVTLLAVYESAN